MPETMAVVVEPDAGEFLWFGAGLFTFKVTSQQSRGAYLLCEDTMGRGKTTPFHVHPAHDETFYLLDGELLVNVNGDEHAARSGSVVAIPRGTPHALLVTSESARLIALVTPGDLAAERFFRDGGEPAPGRVPPPPGTPLNIERILAAGQRTGFMKVLGPPPFGRNGEQQAG